jgi:hypothetical protein
MIMKRVLLFLTVGIGWLSGYSQWDPDSTVNNLIVSNTVKGTSSVANMVTASDGSGGMFICWTDGRNSASSGNDIFITKILADGSIASGFGLGGKPVCTATGGQTSLAMVADGQGGVVVVWTDPRETATNSNDIYAQRINSIGEPVWTLNGVPVVASSVNENNPSIVRISTLEVAIVWRFTGATTNTDLAFNYIALSNGSKSLASDITIIAESNNQTNQQVISDANGGIIVAWNDGRIANNQSGVVAQRYNAGGIRLWDPATGVFVRTPGVNTAGLNMIPDGNGGAIISWADYRVSVGDPNIFIQRLFFNGNIAWGSEGKEVTNATGIQLENAIVRSGTNYIIGWADRRNGNSNIDIYAQAYNSAGNAVWNSGTPVVVSAAENNQPVAGTTPVIIPDGTGGATFIWDDRRFGSGNDDIWAQKINSTGNPVWRTDGVPVCNRTGSNQNSSAAVEGNDGNVIVMWRDSRSGTSNSEIYASRLQTDGLLPVNFLEVTATAKGKNVLVEWSGQHEKQLRHYEVERSENGTNFSKAGTVQARNASGMQLYSFEDAEQSINGNRYYRIKAVDIDGAFTFSNIVKVFMPFDNPSGFMVYPNPAKNAFNVSLSGQPLGSYAIRIIDINGRVVSQNQVQLNTMGQTLLIPVGSLQGGLYKVQVVDQSGKIMGVSSLMKN